MIAITNVAARTAAVVAGLALVASSFAVAAPAKAQSVDALQAQINALLAQIAALQGGSASASATFTMDLTLGSSGAEVTALQNWLISKGYSIPAGATGYFGAQTQSALAAFQAANGISPAAGYFGPITRAKVNGMGGGSTGGSGSTGGLSGGAGSIDSADFITSLNNEEVGEDEEEVEVAGLEIEADDGSDIEITAVSVDFDYADTGASDDLDDYATEVSIWLDGEMYAAVDVDDLDDDDWSKTISLDKGAIIEAGESGELVVAVSGVSNLDSTDAGENWNVAIESVRYRDAQGATITDSTTDDITDGNDDTTTDAGERQFSFETFATAADTELKITLGDDEINDSRTIDVDDSDETNDVEIFSFNVEVEGDSDLNVDEMEVDFDFTGTSNTMDDVFSGVRLMMDGEEVGSESVPTVDSVTFEDLDLDLEAGEEYEFVVVVDILDNDSGTYAEGDTVTARITSTERDAWVVEDESGEDLANGDKTGTASTEAHSLFEGGILVEAVSVDSDANDGETVGTFTIVVDITAFGDDQYVHELADTASSTDAGFYYTVYKNGVATSTNITVGDLVSTSADDDGEYFVINEGQTERFTLTVTVDPDAGGLYTVELDSVRFDPDNAADSASTDDSWYTVPSSEDVETPAESLVAS